MQQNNLFQASSSLPSCLSSSAGRSTSTRCRSSWTSVASTKSATTFSTCCFSPVCVEPSPSHSPSGTHLQLPDRFVRIFLHLIYIFVSFIHFFIILCTFLGLFRQTLQLLQQINVKKCPSSIWHQDSNSQPPDYESPPLTTIPGLPPNYLSIVSL